MPMSNAAGELGLHMRLGIVVIFLTGSTTPMLPREGRGRKMRGETYCADSR
jgi:hypothetical protein